MTLRQLAEAVGMADHRARYLLKRYAIPPSGTIANAAVFHPAVAAWLRCYVADRQFFAKRNETRLKRLREIVAAAQATGTHPVDYAAAFELEGANA